jgi:hypothetical protein
MYTLCITRHAIAQNTIGIDNNILINDITNMRGNQFRNVNTNYTGNQQQAPVQAQTINVQLNNTFGGPNVGVYASPVVYIQQTIRPGGNKVKAPKASANNARPVLPKPKPKNRTVNPAAPNRPVVRPATRSTVAAPVINAPVVQRSIISNPVVVTNPVAMNPPVQNFVAPEQLMNVNTTVSAPVASVSHARSTRMSPGSAGSGSSRSSASHKSKSKKHASFCYSANKKVAKFFAKTRKNHFNPAKCFVWN